MLAQLILDGFPLLRFSRSFSILRCFKILVKLIFWVFFFFFWDISTIVLCITILISVMMKADAKLASFDDDSDFDCLMIICSKGRCHFVSIS